MIKKLRDAYSGSDFQLLPVIELELYKINNNPGEQYVTIDKVTGFSVYLLIRKKDCSDNETKLSIKMSPL